MKIVSEHIYEKFIEDSDPIRDMGIGMEHLIRKYLKEEKNWPDDQIKYLDHNHIVVIFLDEGKIDFVKYILENYKLKKSTYDTACALAAAKGNLELLKLLVEKYKADIDAYMSKSLRWAARNGHYEILKYLIEKGADIISQKAYLYKFAQMGNYKNIIKLLDEYFEKIKESLYERFTKDSDPIRDMGIGILYIKKDFTNLKDFKKNLLFIIPYILNTKEIPKNILIDGGIINGKIFLKLNPYFEKYWSFNGISMADRFCEVYMWPNILYEILVKKGYQHYR